jgi:phosphotransferase system  glucose/maltose/N-acetylglucosamine-specific IIC component
MSEAQLLKKIRRWTLWSVIGAAVSLVILNVLNSWGAIDFTSGGLFMDYGGEPTFWGKLQESLMIVFGFGWAIILSLLFASLIRDRKDKKHHDNDLMPPKGQMKAPAKKR